MPYNFAAESFHTKKLCSTLSSSEVHFFHENRPLCVFEAPFGGLRGNVRRSVTAEELRAIIGLKSAISLQRALVDPKFHVEGVVRHQPFFFSEN